MSIAGYNTKITTVRFPDPAAASKTVPLFKAPAVGATVIRAYAIPTATFDADGSNHYTVTLRDGGQAGTGTTNMGGAGGASVDWTALTQKELTLAQNSVDGGDWIHAHYAETGTVAPGDIIVCVEWTAGGD